MSLLCKRGVGFAAYFSKSSSSSTSRRCISRRSLAESSNGNRVVNHNTLGHGGGRWAVGGAVRSYSCGGGGNEDASSNSFQVLRRNFLNENEIEKRNQESLERYFSILQLETEKLINEIEKRNDKESSSSSELLQFQTEKLRNEIERTIKESSEKLRSEIDKVLEDHTEETTDVVCLQEKVPEEQLDHQEHHFSAFQLEIEKIINEFEKRNNESSELLQFEFEKLRNEIEKRNNKESSSERLQFETEKLRNVMEKRIKESLLKQRSEIDKVLEEETTYYLVCVQKKHPGESLDI